MERSGSTRLEYIFERIVTAMQQIVRDSQITQSELHCAGDFLNRIGHEGVGRSLVDVALAMTSVDLEARRRSVPGTRGNLEGPFYKPGAPARPEGSLLEHEPSKEATLLTLTGRVFDARSGKPIPSTEIDAWQADEHGIYDNEGFHLRGVVRSGADGSYCIRTVVPVDYAEHEEDAIGDLFHLMGKSATRSAHIHVRVRVNGLEVLTTQIFMNDSPRLDSDYVIGAVSDDLIVRLRPGATPNQRIASFDFLV